MNAPRMKAECLGLCLRLGSKLSGRSIRLLERFRIGFEQGACVSPCTKAFVISMSIAR